MVKNDSNSKDNGKHFFISLWLLGIAMKTLPVGTAYGIWVGVGAVGTVILGILLLGESASVGRIVSIALINCLTIAVTG
jgi:multidrug transporter EmrE-like cation transporter